MIEFWIKIFSNQRHLYKLTVLHIGNHTPLHPRSATHRSWPKFGSWRHFEGSSGRIWFRKKISKVWISVTNSTNQNIPVKTSKQNRRYLIRRCNIFLKFCLTPGIATTLPISSAVIPIPSRFHKIRFQRIFIISRVFIQFCVQQPHWYCRPTYSLKLD